MNNLILGNNPSITVLKTKIVKYSKGQQYELLPVLLLDVSGSMNDLVDNVQRKIDVLRSAVSLVGVGQTIFCFSSKCRKTNINEIPDPYDSTDLVNAFQHVQCNCNGASLQLTLISDGIPDDANSAIQYGLLLKCPINVLYIGRHGDAGEQFMKTIAEMTRGRWLTIETMGNESGFKTQLESGITKMLLGSGDNI